MALLVKIGADLKDFDRDLRRATKEIEYVSKKMENVGKTLTKNLTIPILGIGAASVKIGSDFQAGMSEVKAITGSTGKEFEMLENQAKELGSTTKFSAREAADGMKYLGMAGYDTNQIVSSMPGILALAAASGSELAVVSDIVSDAMTAFGMKAEQTSAFTDLLANTSRNANTNVEMLGESFKYVAPVAGALGYSAEDTALALGLMANAGIKGSQAGTALRSSLNRMVNGTGEAKKAMKELGISMTDTNGEMKPMDQLLGELRGSFAGLSEEQKAQKASTIFGREAMSGMLAIINASEEDFNSLTDATKNYNGAATEMADTMQDNLQGQFTRLKSALEGVAIQISEILIPIISQIVDKIASWVNWFASLDQSVLETIVKIAGLVAAIGPALVIVAKIVRTVSRFTAGLKLLKAGIIASHGSILALVGPIAIAVAAIAGIIAIVTHLWKTNEDFRVAIINIWEKIKEGISLAISAARDIIARALDSIKKFWTKWGDDIMGFVDNVFTSIYEIVKLVIELVYEVIKSIMSRIQSFWERWGGTIKAIWDVLWGFIKDTAFNAIRSVSSIIGGVLEVIKGIFNAFIGLVTGDWGRMWDGMKGVAKGAANAVAGIMNGVIGGFESMINGVSRAINKIPSIKIPSWVPGLGGKSFGIPTIPRVSLPRIPKLATGTNIVPQDMLALIHKGESVVPKKYNPALGKEKPSSGGDIHNHFNLEGMVVREEADVEKIARKLYKLQKTKERGLAGAY